MFEKVLRQTQKLPTIDLILGSNTLDVTIINLCTRPVPYKINELYEI